MAEEMDGGEDCFCIDSKPIEAFRLDRSKRCHMGEGFWEGTFNRMLCITGHVLLRISFTQPVE